MFSASDVCCLAVNTNRSHPNPLYHNITSRFMSGFGDKVRSGYQAARAEVPAYAGMTRVMALGKISVYPGDKGGEGFKLLTQYLRDLDPTVIPDDWN